MRIRICLLLALVCLGCEEPTVPKVPSISNKSIGDIAENTVRCNFTIAPVGATVKAGVIYGTDPLLQSGTHEVSTTAVGDGNITLNLEKLEDGTWYAYKVYIQDRMNNSIYSEIDAFRTKYGLLLSTYSLKAQSSAGSYTFKIISNTSWTVSFDQLWCTVQTTSGSGDKEVTISVTENTTTESRKATITVTSGNESKQITLEQEKAAEQTKTVSEFGNGIVAASSFGSGSGAASSPYLISNAQQLKKLVDDVNEGNSYYETHLKLNTDINVTADEWIPIGELQGSTTFSYFSGFFDGNNHKISGTMKSQRYGGFGFFGVIQGGNVSNLTVAADVKNEYNLPNKDTYTGAIAGMFLTSNNIISNCHATGNVTGGNVVNGNSHAGGIAGYSSGSIKDCSLSGNVTVENMTGSNLIWGYIGGIVGRNTGTVTDCIVSGTVTEGLICDDANLYIGGIVGENTGGDGLITNCKVTASGKVIGGKHEKNYTGGIAGENYGGQKHTENGEFLHHPSKIDSCTNEGTVNGGKYYSGGLAGRNLGEIYNSINTGNISGQSFVGGLTGDNFGFLVGSNYGKIYDSLNTGSVSGQSTVGGLTGKNSGEIHTSLNTGNVSWQGNDIAGGLVGSNQSEFDYEGSHYSAGHVYSCNTNRGTVNGQPASDSNQIAGGRAVEQCTDNHTKR